MAEAPARPPPECDSWHILKCHICNQDQNEPFYLQQCLHSFCKNCISDKPKIQQEGKTGWACPECRSFSTEKELKENTFFNDLIRLRKQKKPAVKEAADKLGKNLGNLADPGTVKCEQCLKQSNSAKWKCQECKLALCNNCKLVHLKIPMLKNHQVTEISDEKIDYFIDKLYFCHVHNRVEELLCTDCNKMICLMCKALTHSHHKTSILNNKTIHGVLERIEKDLTQLDSNNNVMEKQLTGVCTKIEEVRNRFAECRSAMDEHIEKVICRIRAMKAQMEDNLAEQETVALDQLDAFRTDLTQEISINKHLKNLADACFSNSKHSSLINILKGEYQLEKCIKTRSEIVPKPIYFELMCADFHSGNSLKQYIGMVFGENRVVISKGTINCDGKVFNHHNMSDEEYNKFFKKETRFTKIP